MTAAMQIGETARARADSRRRFQTGAAVFLHDDGIVAHSVYRNTPSEPCAPARFEDAPMPLRSQLLSGLVQRLLRAIPCRILRANVEGARSGLRRHRLQPRRSHDRFL